MERVLRGGSWNNNNPDYFRCANRNRNNPDNRNNNRGFRVVFRGVLRRRYGERARVPFITVEGRALRGVHSALMSCVGSPSCANIEKGGRGW
ncbi:MAG: SUMF1/EgtB/PvdO family nonheme iron enzyme [Armatimonadetes bacterium]|nr:SUMF1/EgtB/PvdO family nonheme iron enzyme [Armatimonadota bacterium]